MIKATILTEADKYIGYVIEGHANYDEFGYDIVCAAVSVISQATLLGLHLIDEILYKSTSDGHMEILTKNTKEETNLLITILYETIKDISTQYPLNVQITIEQYDG